MVSEQENSFPRKSGENNVLILVLLEDGIGECNIIFFVEAKPVLILVLLEDGIGEQLYERGKAANRVS